MKILQRKVLALTRLGRKEEAKRILDEYVSGDDVTARSSHGIAMSYLYLDDMENALVWFEKAFTEGDPGLVFLAIVHKDGFMSDAHHNDPRIQALYKRMNFPEPPE